MTKPITKNNISDLRAHTDRESQIVNNLQTSLVPLFLSLSSHKNDQKENQKNCSLSKNIKKKKKTAFYCLLANTHTHRQHTILIIKRTTITLGPSVCCCVFISLDSATTTTTKHTSMQSVCPVKLFSLFHSFPPLFIWLQFPFPVSFRHLLTTLENTHKLRELKATRDQRERSRSTSNTSPLCTVLQGGQAPERRRGE